MLAPVVCLSDSPPTRAESAAFSRVSVVVFCRFLLLFLLSFVAVFFGCLLFQDAGHMEVVEKNNRWEQWVVSYLQCKIHGAAAECDRIYSATAGICTKVKASECKLPHNSTFSKHFG